MCIVTKCGVSGCSNFIAQYHADQCEHMEVSFFLCRDHYRESTISDCLSAACLAWMGITRCMALLHERHGEECSNPLCHYVRYTMEDLCPLCGEDNTFVDDVLLWEELSLIHI